MKSQSLMLGLTAFALTITWFGQGCGFLFHQPKVPAKLRETE